jgi:hypothetical protein
VYSPHASRRSFPGFGLGRRIPKSLVDGWAAELGDPANNAYCRRWVAPTRTRCEGASFSGTGRKGKGDKGQGGKRTGRKGKDSKGEGGKAAGHTRRGGKEASGKATGPEGRGGKETSGIGTVSKGRGGKETSGIGTVRKGQGGKGTRKEPYTTDSASAWWEYTASSGWQCRCAATCAWRDCRYGPESFAILGVYPVVVFGISTQH